jgi:hypothetical protein
MLKNESARNATKPVPLRLSRLPNSDGIFNSGGIFTSSVVYRVLSEKSNRQKRGMTVQSIQSTWHVRTADVACPYS